VLSRQRLNLNGSTGAPVFKILRNANAFARLVSGGRCFDVRRETFSLDIR
jgi:hypothetical protein